MPRFIHDTEGVLDTYTGRVMTHDEFVEFINNHLSDAGTLPGEQSSVLMQAILQAAGIGKDTFRGTGGLTPRSLSALVHAVQGRS